VRNMQSSEFEKYVEGRYRDQVRWYDTRAIRNKRFYVRMQWSLVALAALTPVLVTMHLTTLSDQYFVKWLPVVTSVAVAILASALKTFRFQENWANYRTTCETLRKEIHLYHAAAGLYANVRDPEGMFVERVEALISRENTLWFTTCKGQIETLDGQRRSGQGEIG
jgi:hypothetical protein